MGYYIVYAKFDGNTDFHAFNVKEGRIVRRLAFASLMFNNEASQQWLQELAELNRHSNLVLQLRRKGRVCFQTK
jgi:hypothetical protein